MARWVYQMTPHDEWDYDGINEMILAELNVGGKDTPALVHFDRNGFGYTMNRKTGELLVAEKYDPAVNWATHVDMKTGYPQVVNEFSTHYNGQTLLPRTSALPHWAPRTSNLLPTPRKPTCSMYQQTTFA